MALRDDALNYLRQVFGRERAERAKAESPSAEAEKHIPTSMFSVWGREDVGGLLSVSQNLMDRYADYEQMDDYPDINCLTADTTIYVVEGSVIKPFRLHDLAAHGGGIEILAYDAKTQRLVKVLAENPRITGNKQPVVEVGFSNGETIKCTSNHKFLTVEHDYINCSDLIEGTAVVAAWAGFDTKGMSTFLHSISGTLTVTQAARPVGEEDVYDVTTSTHNLIANGVVVHNSTHHYFTNDATQPDIDTGKTLWVHSSDEAIKDMSDVLLNKRLAIEDDIWSMVYSTVKMGNNYEEVLITDHGVVGLNSLPCPTVRRVEQSNGSLIGYVQDVTGKFTQDASDLRGMLAGQTKIPDHVALFEEWQILHSRLRGTQRRCPYGFGVADGARWIWKRLVLLEDAMLIYKLCLRGDSQIWTPDGRVAIKDLEEGDEVYSYNKNDELRKTKVCYKKHNGQDTIYRVYSDHREIFANKTHPVLVEEIIGQGSGNHRARVLKYVEVQNLEPGKHRLVTPKKIDWEEIKLKKPELHSKARLVSAGQVERKISYPLIAKEHGVHHYRARDFFDGNYELRTETAVALLDANGYGPEHLEIEEHWSGSRGLAVKGVTVPDVVSEEFAQWWGFMLGDGFIITRRQKGGHVSQNEVGFALGDDDQTNEEYKELFELLVPEAKLVNDQDHRLGAYTFVSSKFAEFMTLNGFIPGAHNKRLPEWVFRASPEIKLAMIRGLADADAHIIPRREGRKIRYERARFEMCNEQLLQDVRELAMQLGLVVTMVRSRFREGGRTIKGSTQPLKDTTSYCLDITFKPQPMTEMLRGVEEIGTDDIWDIGVEDEEHNFIADGAVVHNTRAPARFAFYIDVTDIPSDKVDSFLRKAKQDLRKQKLVNPRTQRLDMRFNPMDSMEDFFIAVRENRELARVEVLQGPDYQATEDVEYFQRKLHGVLKVPRSYLGQDDAIPQRSILSFEDVRAARVTMSIQREMKNTIRRLIMIDLAARGINPFTQDLQVMMTVPSGIYELAHNEIKNARADFATRVQPFVSMRYIQERILKLSDDEIKVIEKEREEDMKKQAEQQQAMGGAPGGDAPPPPGAPPMDAGSGDPNAQHPGNLDVGPPPGVAGRPNSPTEWKRYDAARRLEEKRDRESWKRDAELQELKQQNKQLTSKMNQHESFIRELRSTYMSRNGKGKLLPQTRGRGHVRQR